MVKTVALISGGIDSPVAAYLVSRKMEVIPLHFCLHPLYCETSFELVMESLKTLRVKVPFEKAILYPWGDVPSTILGTRARRYMCVLFRRGMFKGAELVCEAENAEVITTGESLGQKASQTLQNLTATSHGVTYPILRPLIGLDKVEIERISRKIGLWREKHVGCCSATPSKPATGTRVEVLDDLYEKLNIGALVEAKFKERLEMKIRSESDIDELYLRSLKQLCIR
jgi:thiamine biosynthesis protein ThiI